MTNANRLKAPRQSYTVHVAEACLYLREGRAIMGRSMSIEEKAMDNCMAAFDNSEQERKQPELQRDEQLANTCKDKVFRLAICFALPLLVYVVAVHMGAIK